MAASCWDTEYRSQGRSLAAPFCLSERKSLSLSLTLSDSLWLHGLYSPWNSPDQNTGVGSLFLLQGIFPTQRSNPGLPHCRWILHQLSHKGSPRILEWVGYPFSSGSSWPRNWTRVSCIAGGFFTNWTTREAQRILTAVQNGFPYLPSCQHYRTTHVLTPLLYTLENFVSHLS